MGDEGDQRGLEATDSQARNGLVPSPGRYRLQLLGGFRLARCGRSFDLPVGSQRLIAMLGLCGRMMRTTVAGSLWPDASEPHAHASLRTTLWRISRTAAELVEVNRDGLGLDDSVEIDVDRLRTRGDDADQVGDGASGTIALLVGELLPGWYDDWVLFERERLRHVRLHALERLATRDRDRGRYYEAIDYTLHAIHLEPLRESAHRLLISIHLAAGNYSEAIHHFDAFSALLERELGVAPSPQMCALLSRHNASVTQA